MVLTNTGILKLQHCWYSLGTLVVSSQILECNTEKQKCQHCFFTDIRDWRNPQWKKKGNSVKDFNHHMIQEFSAKWS